VLLQTFFRNVRKHVKPHTCAGIRNTTVAFPYTDRKYLIPRCFMEFCNMPLLGFATMAYCCKIPHSLIA
jgi:hypothetical protein